jgi:hypothetical protein
MQNPESYFSICVTFYTDKYTKLLRLADIGENRGKIGGRLLPFDEKSDLPDVKTISMYSKIADPNELCIWEWRIDQYDSNKQYSRPVPETFYELVFLNNPDLNIGLLFPPLPFWEIFDTLLEGFIVPLQHSKAFLLVINQTETEYICLEVTESSYSVDGNKIKIHENTPLKEYKIPKLDFFDTENYITNLGVPRYRLDPAFQRRIIYKRRTIWGEPVATLPLKRLNTHLAEYLKQVVTRLPDQTGNKEVIEAFIKNVTENVKPNSDLMTFIGNYYSQSHHESIVQTLGEHPLLESVFTSYSKKSSTDEKFLKVIIEHLPSLREKYLQILTDSYLKEEKRKLQYQLDPLQTQIEELNTKLNEKNIRIEELEAEIASSTDLHMKLLAHIRESEQRKQDLDELLNGKRTGLLQELTILNRVLQFGETTCETTPQNTIASGLTIRPGKILENEDLEPEEIIQLDAMYSILSDNLPENGVDTPDVSELSKFISASYLHHLPLLCVGTSADEMARIISISFKNQEPDTVCVPTGYNNYSSLLSTIRSLKGDIVVLENMVGYCDEYCYTHLAKDIPEKYFIFLLEYEETLKLLPKGIYAHMGLINCDKFFTTLKSDEHLYPGKITGPISFPVDTNAKHSLLSKLLKLTHGSPVSTGYVNSRVKILQGITPNEDNISEIIMVICTELKSIIEIYGLSEEYKDKLCTSTDPVIKDFKKRLGVETE